MKDFLTVNHIIEEKVDINGIPSILFRPKDHTNLLHTVIFYHG